MTGADLDAALARVGEAQRLLVALDFDGTLAPFADDPADVGALPASWAAILTLERARDTHVALVSGRSMRSLREVTHAPDAMALVGSHGVEWRVDGRDEESLTDEEHERVARVGALLDELGTRYPDVGIEHKPTGNGVHTRRVDAATASAVNDEATRIVTEADPDALVRAGKDILEFSVRHLTKGDAIERLREHLGADRVVFAGDDVTDEDGFRVLDQDAGDVGIKVGPGETLARYRVEDPAALSDVLRTLARTRATRPADASRASRP
jgi:trehalose 6-phosphate phosphatase